MSVNASNKEITAFFTIFDLRFLYIECESRTGHLMAKILD